jgi:hypothetical protein
MTHRVRILSIGLLATLAALAAGCGGDSPGSIRVAWQLGAGVQCTEAVANIDTIRVRVLRPQGNKEVVAPASFGCGAGSATVQAIPAGTYNLAIEGLNASAPTTVVFSGQLGGVVVKSGQAIDVGTVVLEKLPETVNPGGLSISWNFGGPLCSGAGVSQVRLQVWLDRVYRKHDQTYPCDSPAVALDVPPGSYAIIGEGLDAQGRVVRRASQSSVTVSTGSQTDVTLVLQ